jgi:excisionase family DNA binding protein
MNLEGYMTTSEAAAALGVTDARIRQLIADKKLPAEKFGWGIWLISKDAVEAYKGNKPRRGRPRNDAK